jgi:hypothetical protein
MLWLYFKRSFPYTAAALVIAIIAAFLFGVFSLFDTIKHPEAPPIEQNQLVERVQIGAFYYNAFHFTMENGLNCVGFAEQNNIFAVSCDDSKYNFDTDHGRFKYVPMDDYILNEDELLELEVPDTEPAHE